MILLLSYQPFCKINILIALFAVFSFSVLTLQEDDDARAVVLEQLLRDGIDLKFNLKFIRVESEHPEEETGAFPLIRVVVEQDGEEMVSSCPPWFVISLTCPARPGIERLNLVDPFESSMHR